MARLPIRQEIGSMSGPWAQKSSLYGRSTIASAMIFKRNGPLTPNSGGTRPTGRFRSDKVYSLATGRDACTTISTDVDEIDRDLSVMFPQDWGLGGRNPRSRRPTISTQELQDR